MPGLTPAIGDLIQFRTCCYTPTQVSLNVMNYWVVATGAVPSSLAFLTQLYSNRVHTAYKNLMPSAATYRGVGGRNLQPPMTREVPFVGDNAVGNTGTVLAPTQSTALINFNAAPAGRRYLGRIYPGLISVTLIGLDGGLNLTGTAAVASLAALLGPTLDLTDDGNITTLNLTVRHPDISIPVPRTPQWSAVTAMHPSTLIATQKRRGEFGRQNLPPF